MTGQLRFGCGYGKEVRKIFFFEKKEAKSNGSPPPPADQPSGIQLLFRPSPVSSNQHQKVKVFWFFSSEKNKTLLFLKKKKQKDFYVRRVVFSDTGLGRKVIANQHLQGLARGEQLQ